MESQCGAVHAKTTKGVNAHDFGHDQRREETPGSIEESWSDLEIDEVANFQDLFQIAVSTGGTHVPA